MTLPLSFSGQIVDDAMPVIGRASRIAVSKVAGICITMKKQPGNARKKSKV